MLGTIIAVDRGFPFSIEESLSKSSLLPSIQCVPTPARIRLLELIPLPRLHRLSIRPAVIILVRLSRSPVARTAAVNYAPPTLLLRKVLIDRHGRQAVVGPENTVAHILPVVQQRKWLQRFPLFT